jgi:hypothetical protein
VEPSLLGPHFNRLGDREDDLALRGLDFLLELGRLENLRGVGGSQQQMLLVFLGEAAGLGLLVDRLIDAPDPTVGITDRQGDDGTRPVRLSTSLSNRSS